MVFKVRPRTGYEFNYIVIADAIRVVRWYRQSQTVKR